ncbi:MAG TPA: RHS repeat-associated core domain-containing protein [Bryobacteraceae bacterium]|nr:RHS repeat-associated core domain-containing protein [Bryobacteraceae bacterium]
MKWILLDHLGSPRDFFVGATGLVNHITRDSFGRPLFESAFGFDTSVDFTGHQDGPFGDVYMNARNYDPRSGRFRQEDPLQPNGYDYARGNPMSFFDPTGAFGVGEYLFTMVVSPAAGYYTGTGIPADGSPFELVSAWAPSLPGFIGHLSGFSASTFQFLGAFLTGDQLSLPDRWGAAVESAWKARGFCPNTSILYPEALSKLPFGGYCGGYEAGIERLVRLQPR